MVGVDPVRVAQLASRLESLRDSLHAGHAPIRHALQQYVPGADIGALDDALHRCDRDAADMRARARLAEQLAREEHNTMIGHVAGPVTGVAAPRAGWVHIPWDRKDVSSELGNLDTRRLHTALHGGGGIDRAELRKIANDLREHTGDKHFLRAFWSHAGPDAANLARLLHNQHATGDDAGKDLFTADDTGILKAFGGSLAGASKADVLPDGIDKTFAGSDDLWSASMLFKFGPNGKSYGEGNGANLLASMTRSLIDHKGKFDIPVGPRADRSYSAADHQAKQLAEYDPRVAVFDRAAQNGAAARHVLGGANGQRYTKALLTRTWKTPGFNAHDLAPGTVPDNVYQQVDAFDLSPHVAALLKAAAAAPRGNTVDAKESAWAVTHMIDTISSGRPATIPPAIKSALFDVSCRYIPDFAANSDNPEGDYAHHEGDKPNGPWAVDVNMNIQRSFFDRILTTPGEIGAFRGVVMAQMTGSVGRTASSHGEDYLRHMGSLYGLVQSVEGDHKFDAAARSDAKQAEVQMLISVLGTGFGKLSLGDDIGRRLKTAQNTYDVGSSAISSLIPSQKALQALHDEGKDFDTSLPYVRAPVVQV